MPPKAAGTAKRKAAEEAVCGTEAASQAPHARRSVRPKPAVNYNEEKLLEAAEATAVVAKGGMQRTAAAGIEIRVTRPIPTSESARAELVPKRDDEGRFVFPDFPAFRPNLSPEEVLRAGSFGGTYFRPIRSSVMGGRLVEKAWEDEASHP